MTSPTEIMREADKMPDLRRGQSLFVALHNLDPDAAEAIRGDHDTDPFYNDNNIPRFWARLAELNQEAA